MRFDGVCAGFALTGSFCSIAQVVPQISGLIKEGARVLPIVSEVIARTDTRFGKAAEILAELSQICGGEVISTVRDAEPIGPKKLIDALIIAPCTGNTLGKLAGGITDSTVTMAAKAHLRNGRPLIIGVSTNDGLAGSAKNVGLLLNTKNVYFVPFGQDNPQGKPRSLMADFELIPDALQAALKGEQLQPILL
ncbi:MAG: dipicolinate synthase subunit B [Clostridiales bacterium]|jgi:dipicolinate synthase subunit B|nr:dipicolinate synthase subunit B [Clostridiales bacterium]